MTAALNHQQTEHQLAARMASDDRSALQSLYEAYYPHLCKLFAHLSVTREWPVIEQLIEDTMMEVWLSRGAFSGTGSVYVWIMRLALRQQQQPRDGRQYRPREASPQRHQQSTDPKSRLIPLSHRARHSAFRLHRPLAQSNSRDPQCHAARHRRATLPSKDLYAPRRSPVPIGH